MVAIGGITSASSANGRDVYKRQFGDRVFERRGAGAFAIADYEARGGKFFELFPAAGGETAVARAIPRGREKTGLTVRGR